MDGGHEGDGRPRDREGVRDPPSREERRGLQRKEREEVDRQGGAARRPGDREDQQREEAVQGALRGVERQRMPCRTGESYPPRLLIRVVGLAKVLVLVKPPGVDP